jgi:hypothetical protein
MEAPGVALAAAAIAASLGCGVTPVAPLPERQQREIPRYPADSDFEMGRRIDIVRALAEGLVMDGNGDDWAGIPSAKDADPEPIADQSLDITEVSLAPREDDIMVLLRTAARPSGEGVLYGIAMDIYGDWDSDCDVGVTGEGAIGLNSRDDESNEYDYLLRTDLRCACLGEAVEFRVPHSEIGRLFASAGKPPEVPLRAWIRIRTYTWALDGEGVRHVIDYGPAIASYRLVSRRGPLDPPLKDGGETARTIALPVDGSWFVSQGGFSPDTHADVWAYDLALKDRGLRSAPPGGERPREMYYTWGAPLRAPEAGEVVEAVWDMPDRTMPQHDDRAAGDDDPNKVGIRLDDGLSWYGVHLMQGSVRVKVGDRVEAGALLGQVGLSGDTAGPHLHMVLRKPGSGYRTVPLSFGDVIVGINPGPDDVWARRLDSWPIREGYFVERAGPWLAPPPSPRFGPAMETNH